MTNETLDLPEQSDPYYSQEAKIRQLSLLLKERGARKSMDDTTNLVAVKMLVRDDPSQKNYDLWVDILRKIARDNGFSDNFV